MVTEGVGEGVGVGVGVVEGLGLRLKVRVRVRGGVKVVGCYLVAEGLELGVGLGVIAGRHHEG